MATATAPAVYEQGLPPGAGNVAASYPAAASIPDSVSPETLNALYAERSGKQLTPEQRLLLLHQEQKNQEAAAHNGRIMATNVVGMGGSMVASHVTQKALEKGVEVGSTKALAGIASKAGVVGQVVSVGISGVSGDMEAKQRLSELVGLHIEDMQREFHIKPEEMTDAHLRRLADMPGYEQLKKEIQGLDQKMGRAVTGAAASAAAWAGTSAAIPLMLAGAGVSLTGVGAIAGVPAFLVGAGIFVASMATSMVAGSVADKAVSAISGVDPSDSAYTQLTAMQEKLKNHQPVDQIDVFKALLAGNRDLQEAIAKQTGGKKFDDLKPAEQEELLHTHHGNLLDASKQLAYQINCGETLPTRLISINTVALQMEGAKGAYDLTRHDVSRGMGENILQTPEPIPANDIAPVGKPTTSISPDGAVTTAMQPRVQGMGAQEAALAARQAQEATYGQQLGA